MSADTPENRAYIQQHRLWLVGEIITLRLIADRPADPVKAVLAVLQAEKAKPTEVVDPPSPEVAADAKGYLQEHRIAFLVEDWLRAVLESKPAAPIEFSCEYFTKLQNAGLSEVTKATETPPPQEPQPASEAPPPPPTSKSYRALTRKHIRPSKPKKACPNRLRYRVRALRGYREYYG